ncbi:hypothetical protein [Mycolicibacterium mengxianglii]|uniref:hypothetical protein n=1 Tax=Mycolicibacterium mengxianglii TaxID=2736649 RepID=UPI0018D0A106|nr:hypothetical protein [Mycolicibacterium mengxianglii]
MSNQGIELAYNAGIDQLAAQTTTMESLRTRANNILAATALFISFAAGVGLINTDPSRGAVLHPTAGVLLFAVVVALSCCALYVVWPAKNWVFVTSAKKILERYDAGDDEAAIRRYVIGELIEGAKSNHAKMKAKQKAFRWAASLLVAEIVLLVGVLLTQQIGS